MLEGVLQRPLLLCFGAKHLGITWGIIIKSPAGGRGRAGEAARAARAFLWPASRKAMLAKMQAVYARTKGSSCEAGATAAIGRRRGTWAWG